MEPQGKGSVLNAVNLHEAKAAPHDFPPADPIPAFA